MFTMPNDITMESVLDAMDTLLKSQGRIYMHLAKTAVDRFGLDGERSVRLGLRAYGHWRGGEMREAHHALGRPINMKTLMTCWDNASTYIDKDSIDNEGRFEDFDTEFNVRRCPASEAWKAGEFHQMGHWYCDEFHQAAARTYHPDGNVTIHENLMKGDDHCHFRWLMPPNSQEVHLGLPTKLGERLADDYRNGSELEAAWKALKRANRLLGGHFFTCAQPIIERHGELGQQAVRDALASWGGERGELLAEQHQSRGMELSLENFIRHHDLPVRLIWPLREIEMTSARVVVEIDETPQDEAFDDTGLTELGQLWYEAAYPAMVSAYLPAADAVWTRLLSRGDRTNRLELSLGLNVS